MLLLSCNMPFAKADLYALLLVIIGNQSMICSQQWVPQGASRHYEQARLWVATRSRFTGARQHCQLKTINPSEVTINLTTINVTK